MPSSNRRPRSMTEYEPANQGGRWIGWAVYASTVLVAFGFGVVAGTMRPKTIEVVKTVPAETKPEVKPPEKKEPEKKEPEKKEQPIVKIPEPKIPEPKIPEPKMPEPKPEPK